MGVYIKGMEMPTSCGFCPLRYESDIGDACSADINVSTQYQTRPEDCPLVPVPPHGRLIDADALRAEFPEPNEENGGWRNPDEALVHKTGVWAMIDVAPTIIPAEEGE